MADKAKHTPGPWATAVDIASLDGLTPSGSLCVTSETKQPGMRGNVGCVCVVSPPSNTTDEDQANAHLIAAAPDLLAACKASLEEKQFHSHGTVKMLCDAIAKAEPPTGSRA